MKATMESRVMMVIEAQQQEKDRNKGNSQMIYLIPECWLIDSDMFVIAQCCRWTAPTPCLNKYSLLLGGETVKGDHQQKIERGTI